MMKKAFMCLSLAASLFAANQIREEKVDENGNKEITTTTVVQGSHNVLPGGENSETSANLKSPEIQALLRQAYQKGYQAGAEQSMRDMNFRLIALEKYLDGLFNFHRLVLEGKYEPPKIGIVNQPVEVSEDGQTMSIQARTFKILAPGRFVEEIPSWKTFLLDGNK